MATSAKATISDLYREREKAEIVGGEVVVRSPTGGLPGMAGGITYASLREHQLRARDGYAYPDNVGFVVDPPNRRSFPPQPRRTPRNSVGVRPVASLKALLKGPSERKPTS